MQMQPITPNLTEALKTSVGNAFRLLKFRVSLDIKPTEKAPVTVLSPAGQLLVISRGPIQLEEVDERRFQRFQLS